MISLLKISWLNMWGFISRISILFQLAICLLYFSTSLVLISVAFYTFWSLSLPTLFLFFKVFFFFIYPGSLKYPYGFLSIVYFCKNRCLIYFCKKKCSWDLDKDFFDSVFAEYYHLNNIKSFDLWALDVFPLVRSLIFFINVYSF